MDNVISIPKEEAATVRWLQDGASADIARGPLYGIFIDGEYAVTADGFQLRRVPVPASLKEFDQKIVRIIGKVTTKGGVYQYEIIEGNFPPYKQILPGEENTITTNPVQAKIAFDMKLMESALHNFPRGEEYTADRVIAEIRGVGDPIILQTSVGLVVVMPMRME
jgi:hypothetical protein